MYPNIGQKVYKAAAGENQVIMTGRCILHRIIIGADVSSSVVEVSDSATDGDGNVVIQLNGSSLSGVYEVGAYFEKGITVDTTNQTQVTYVVSPSN